MSTINILKARQILGRKDWAVPVEFGPDGWKLDRRDRSARIIVTSGPVPMDDGEWLHASISRPDSMPTYEDLVALHKAFWPDGHAYQCFVPSTSHVNIHNYALHLFGKPDGQRLLPDFGAMGTI